METDILYWHTKSWNGDDQAMRNFAFCLGTNIPCVDTHVKTTLGVLIRRYMTLCHGHKNTNLMLQLVTEACSQQQVQSSNALLQSVTVFCSQQQVQCFNALHQSVIEPCSQQQVQCFNAFLQSVIEPCSQQQVQCSNALLQSVTEACSQQQVQCTIRLLFFQGVRSVVCMHLFRPGVDAFNGWFAHCKASTSERLAGIHAKSRIRKHNVSLRMEDGLRLLNKYKVVVVVLFLGDRTRFWPRLLIYIRFEAFTANEWKEIF
jgi:hypothetical protein